MINDQFHHCSLITVQGATQKSWVTKVIVLRQEATPPYPPQGGRQEAGGNTREKGGGRVWKGFYAFLLTKNLFIPQNN
jgi:hypothetical protein